MDKRKMKNYEPLTVSAGCAGILRIGKNFDLFRCEGDCGPALKNTFNIISVIALTQIKDSWYI